MATIAHSYTARLTGTRTVARVTKSASGPSPAINRRAVLNKTNVFSIGSNRVGLRSTRGAVTTRAVDDSEKTNAEGTLDSLSSILGIDPEEELRVQREAEEKIEKELRDARAEADAARALKAEGDQKQKPQVITRAASSGASADEGDIGAPERAIAALSYLLPLLDGLKYSKFLLMQFPLFGLALLPLKPAIDVWYGLGFLQIVVFFGLYLGVVQNQNMKYFTRYNAQQAVLLDILLIVPDVLTRLASGLGGDDALLMGGPGFEAQVLMFNTVFLYVYLSSVVGVGASALGKTIKLPLVGDAAENQTNMR